MKRVIAETIFACFFILACYQWSFYEGEYLYKVQQKALLFKIETRLYQLTEKANQTYNGMNKCWRELRYNNWKNQWEKN